MTIPPRSLPRVWYRAPMLGALGYIAFALLWVLGGDWLMALWFPSIATLSWANTGKGMLFVLLSALLLYVLLGTLRQTTERHLSLLHSTEATFRRLFDSHPEPMWVFSLETLGILEVNRAAVQLYGYSREQMLGMSIRDLREPGQQGELDRALERVKRDPEDSVGGRFVHRDGRGNLLHVRVRGRDIDYFGQRARLVEVTPIDDTLRLERERERLQEQIDALQQVGQLAIWQMDPITGDIDGAESAEAHLGLAGGSFPRHRGDFAGWVRAESRHTLLLALERALEGVEPLDIECQLNHDGRYVRLHAMLAEPGNDSYPVLQGGVSDVSELKRLEEALRRRAERFAAVVDALPDAVLIAGPDGDIRYANDAALRQWRMAPGLTLVGSRLAQWVSHSGTAGATDDALLRTCRMPDGQELSLPCAEFSIAEGRETLSVLVVRGDAHSAGIGAELRNANARLRKLSQRLVSMQESERRKLARDLHDEVGQALAAVSMHIDLMARKDGAGGQLERIARLREIVAAALQQVRHMLLALRPPQLDELGLGAAISAQLDRLADNEALRLEMDCPPLVPRPAPEIESVAFRLAQECLTNVVKHAGATLVKVKLRCLHERGELEVEVIDDGCGFDGAEKGEGAGRLGLLSMRERVALVGGELRIESVRGLGTRVCARLPLETPQEVLADG